MSDATRIPLGHTTTGHVTMDHDPEWGPLRSMLDRFDKAVEVLGLDLGMVSYLKTPHRQVVISVPIRSEGDTIPLVK